ncbi:hypothetical protein [Microbacterium murale]|nr:hypothetical protein [Microbacterium murale]
MDNTFTHQNHEKSEVALPQCDKRPLGSVVGEEKIREWHDGWQPLPWFKEQRIGPESTTDEIVSAILRDLSGPSGGSA